MKVGRIQERKKKREKRKNKEGWDLGGSWKRRNNKQIKICTLINPLHQQEDQLRQRKIFGVLEENTAIRLKQLKWKWSSTNGQCHSPALPNHKWGCTGARY